MVEFMDGLAVALVMLAFAAIVGTMAYFILAPVLQYLVELREGRLGDGDDDV